MTIGAPLPAPPSDPVRGLLDQDRSRMILPNGLAVNRRAVGKWIQREKLGIFPM